ncbi:spore germination protein [Paenibacillus sp. GM2]|uniref:spore germination protein n=1 Tax=Paenibacillus sp. GM2 TaxID=1622070 RepID=UPI000838AB3A|nr:spore germination protein [Paenibacillus sp. GM2]
MWETKLRDLLEQNSDIVFRKMEIQSEIMILVYIEGLVNDVYVQEQIIPSLFHGSRFDTVPKYTLDEVDQALQALFNGSVLVLTNQSEFSYVFSGEGIQSRSIVEPTSEHTLRGPRDGFVESISTNLSLIRRRYPDTRLQVRISRIGAHSKTKVALVYVDGIVNPDILKEVEQRMNSIQIDELLDSGAVEQWIEDSWYSPFPQVQYTEQPVRVVSAIAEGRIAIVVDGTPIVLMVPLTFSMLFQAMDDYSERWLVGSAIRFIRIIGSILALILPALYIALLSYHPGMIPTQLTLSIAASRADAPFPAFVEALLMEATLELLREAGLRLPGFIGQTIGIVGGLVIGQAAVEAGIVSPIMVIVVALTAICSFMIPAYNGAIAIRLLRFPLMVFVSFLGMLGLILGVMIIIAHLVSLKSFGVNYLSPFAPYQAADWKDSVIRAPLPLLKKRPSVLKPLKEQRLKLDQRKKGW